MQYVGSGMQFAIPARYGFMLVPGMLAVAGTAIRTQRGGWATQAVGGVLFLLIARKLFPA
jgi:hypothetical protein